MSQSGRTIKQIGSYQYNERHCLGEGAYGKVFQGEDIRTKEIVAIKKMDLALFEKDAYLRNQIVSEIEILKKFNHPNIVKFIDLITTQRSLYIVTEYCKDGDLKELLAKKRLNEKEAQAIMLQIVNGFKELVKHGVIHRDLKPANILNHEGVVKIADFGFAKYVDNYTSQLLRSCVGSPLYMAPQILQRKTYSTKCDIWSIGVMFYEMIFYDVPWKGRDEQDLLKNILIKPMVFKSGFQISDFTKELLIKTLAVDENERFSWDQCFQLFEQQEKLLVPQNATLQKLYGDQTWMQKNQNALQGDQLQQQLDLCIKLRELLAFKHFVNLEFHQKYDIVKQYYRKDQAIEDCLFTMSRIIQLNMNSLMNLIQETCDSGEDTLMKGTKWNIVNNLKKEQDYYQIFYDQCKDAYNKDFIETELSDIERVKNEDQLLQKVFKLVQDLLEEICKKKMFTESSKYNIIQLSNYDTLIILDYLADTLVFHKNLSKVSETDYQMAHQEKSITVDSQRIIERIQGKLRIYQKL